MISRLHTLFFVLNRYFFCGRILRYLIIFLRDVQRMVADTLKIRKDF